MNKVISVAKDFSRLPAGVYRSDGPFSARAFLEDVLLPAILALDTYEGYSLTVDLDGTQGFASNWLKEVFEGLGDHYCPADLGWFLIIRSDSDTSLAKEALSYFHNSHKQCVAPDLQD